MLSIAIASNQPHIEHYLTTLLERDFPLTLFKELTTLNKHLQSNTSLDIVLLDYLLIKEDPSFLPHLLPTKILLCVPDDLEEDDVPLLGDMLKQGVFDLIDMPSFHAEVLWYIERASDIYHYEISLYDTCPNKRQAHLALEAYYKLSHKRIEESNTITESEFRTIFQNNPPENLSEIIQDMMHAGSFDSLKKEGHILIVEDEAGIRENYRRSLAPRLTIYEAIDGNQAKAHLKKHPEISVVLLDIGLPLETGDTLIKPFLNINPDLAIIMVTAYKDSELISKSIKHGAYDYMVKGFNIRDLFPKIVRAFQFRFLMRAFKPPVTQSHLLTK